VGKEWDRLQDLIIKIKREKWFAPQTGPAAGLGFKYLHQFTLDQVVYYLENVFPWLIHRFWDDPSTWGPDTPTRIINRYRFAIYTFWDQALQRYKNLTGKNWGQPENLVTANNSNTPANGNQVFAAITSGQNPTNPLNPVDTPGTTNSTFNNTANTASLNTWLGLGLAGAAIAALWPKNNNKPAKGLNEPLPVEL
jgi:hypothetical protein